MTSSAIRFSDENLYLEQSRFALDIANYLELNPQNGELIALLEAGSAVNGVTSDLLAAIEDYPPKQWSMLLKNGSNLEEVAPYLINLTTPEWYEPQSSLTRFSDWLFKDKNFAQMGIFFVSQAPFSGVKAFWQRFSQARLNSKTTAYFRFYNPRFFDSLVKNIGKEEYQSISTVVSMIFYFDYFNPHIVHICHFYQHGYKKEQYNLKLNKDNAFISSLFKTV